MSDSTASPRPPEPFPQPVHGAPPHHYPAAQGPVLYQPSLPGPYQAPLGPVGAVRSTGTCILLTVVTLGIYPLFWYFKVHDEMKRHTGNRLGGGIALLIAFFIGIVMPYLTSDEVGDMYTRRGQAAPVSGLTGLWYFPGMLIIVGPIVWFIKTNGALNDYWRSLGAV